jgi:phosphate transport system substrate-binding protein
VMAGTLFAGCSTLQSTPASPQGQLTIAGSTALQPLVTQAAERFTQANPKVKISVAGGGSLLGLQEVNAHKIDIGDSDVYADPATYPDPNLTDHLVAVIPFAMITNLDVNVTNLSTDQIIAIYSTGTIRNWKQVGGLNLAIVPVVRPVTSGTRASFRKYVLGGRDEQGKVLLSDSSQTVVQTVADTPGAIGYLALSVLDSTVREVAIDGQLPSVKTIQTGQYAFWGFEHMYTIGLGSPAMMSFLNYMLTPQIQQLAEKLGYFSIAAMAVASRHGNNTGNGNSVEAAAFYRPQKDAVSV